MVETNQAFKIQKQVLEIIKGNMKKYSWKLFLNKHQSLLAWCMCVCIFEDKSLLYFV
jgi:hypothetical protein